ncbi:hypothetical protein K432DRAFT_308849 [Lepidopterella palustris CBS 459.81]|uniref:Uncharacterized protein n=1 Tax=Lepidopterella palustris CBS 459.81 TaxID=1314670 RepID=A0A8E2E135_9PEZI|nr:hypothetical protein K432DRAFT_308849 [Lepidopterella palustris CBS 459.81]
MFIANNIAVARPSIRRTGNAGINPIFKSEAQEELDIRRKVLRRFYEPVLILHALDPHRGDRIEEITDVDPALLDITKLRRSFIKYLAYICDYEKGGNTCTSVALQQKPSGVRVWMAANVSIKPKTVQFLHEVLTGLSKVEEKTRDQFHENLMSMVVAFGSRRILDYLSIVKCPLELCISELKRKSEELPYNSKDRNLLAHLQDIQRACGANDHAKLVQECFKARSTTLFTQLARCIQTGIEKCPFRILRHNLGRLGEHAQACKILVQAALELPELIQNFKIKVHVSAKQTKIPLIEKQSTLECLANRFSSNPEISQRLFHRLDTLDRWSRLSERLQDDCSTKTRIHAELYLVQLFHKGQFEFVHGEKYVGCSKPACYLCYEYISALGSGISLPASSNKIYLAWRPPNFDFGMEGPFREAAEKEMEGVLNRMTERIRGHVEEQMNGKMGRRHIHPDSTTGVSTAPDKQEKEFYTDPSDDETSE